MVEPFTIVATAASLAIRVVKFAKDIDTFRSKYKQAPFTFAYMSAECSSITAILIQLQQLTIRHTDTMRQQFDQEPQLAEFFENALENLVMVFSVLEGKLKDVTEKSRTKIVWNEKSWIECLDLVKRHFINLNLLLSILQR